MPEKVGVKIRNLELKKGTTASKAKKSNLCQSIYSPFDHILFLQSTIGNQGVQRLVKSGVIQAKLKIGQPNDIYEQEADRVAEQVMKMPEDTVISSQWSVIKKDESVQAKPASASNCPLCKEEEPIQPKPRITPLIRRQVEEDEEEILQEKEVRGKTPEVTPNIETGINTLRASGQPLPESVRNYFEPRFGYDFSQVRVHTGSKAEEINRDLNAQAFTYGSDIYFGVGGYGPSTSSGKRLLAHELTHVMQQTNTTGANTIRRIGRSEWTNPEFNRRNAASVFFSSQAFMRSPVGETHLIINGREINSNADLETVIPQPPVATETFDDGTQRCWYTSAVSAEGHTILDILTQPPWHLDVRSSEAAHKYDNQVCLDRAGGEGSITTIIVNEHFGNDNQLESSICLGEMEHNNAYQQRFKPYIGNYINRINSYLGPQNSHTVTSRQIQEGTTCERSLRKNENRQLLTDYIIATNQANEHIHRNQRHVVSISGISINDDCSRITITAFPPNL